MRRSSGPTRRATNTKITPFTLPWCGVSCVYLRPSYCLYTARHDCASVDVIPLPSAPSETRNSYAGVEPAHSLIHSTFANVAARRCVITNFFPILTPLAINAMLKENSRYDNRNTSHQESRPLASSRLPAIEELTLGLKQKLHLQARARAAPYYIRKQEPVDLVERLLEQRALVAEAVRRLQEKKQPCHEISVDS